MNPRLHWHRLRVAFLAVALALSVANVPAMFSGNAAHVVEATVAQDDKDKDKNKNNEDEADRIFNGQVIEIDTLKDPPELVAGSVDGLTVIKVLKTDEIVMNGVRLGDSIEARGEKIHEQLFEATELSVSSRFADTVDDDGDDDD